MTIKQQIYEYLEKETRFRERRNKDRGIVNLLVMKYPVLREISKDILVEVVRDYNSMDRYWRMVLDKERPDWRGSDYGTKDIVEQTKELELGYESGYKGNQKKLKTL
jgi:hypothetical protein